MIGALSLLNSSQLFDLASEGSMPLLRSVESANGFGAPIGFDPADHARQSPRLAWFI
jgi:hypothetical protein